MWKGKKLYLNKEEEKFSGVASGLADYTGIDVTLIRLVFVILGLYYGLGAVIFYIIASYIIPDKPVSKGKDDNSYYTDGGDGWNADSEDVPEPKEEPKSYYDTQEELDLDDILADSPTKEHTEEEFVTDILVEDEIILDEDTTDDTPTEPVIEEVNEVGISEVWESQKKRVTIELDDDKEDVPVEDTETTSELQEYEGEDGRPYSDDEKVGTKEYFTGVKGVVKIFHNTYEDESEALEVGVKKTDDKSID